MVTRDQVRNGVKNFVDREIVDKMQLSPNSIKRGLIVTGINLWVDHNVNSMRGDASGIAALGVVDENGHYVVKCLEYTMRLSAEVRLSRVSRAVYSRYLAQSFENSALSSLVLFDSTHEYPSNVKGGIGMVNVFSSALREIEIGTFHYDMYNYHQIEEIFGD